MNRKNLYREGDWFAGPLENSGYVIGSTVRSTILKKESLIDEAHGIPSLKFGIGASPDEIAIAERLLGIAFPNDFAIFLKEFGWLSVGHLEFFGLGTDVPNFLNLVEITIWERDLAFPQMQRNLVPAMADGFGNHYCLDTGKIQNGICPIVFWDHDDPRDQIPDVVASSFSEWLREEIDDLKNLEG